MIPTLLAANTQKGMAIPNAAITNPPSIGPAARPILKATPLAARGRGEFQGDQTGENHGHREDHDFDRNKQSPGIDDVGQGS